MFTVEGRAFKDLMEARHFTWDLSFKEPHIIYSVDGQPHEAWKGRRELDLMETMMAEYSTPLIFTNSFPDGVPVTLDVGEVKETKNKDAQRFDVQVHTPFQTDQRGQTVTIQGKATVYWKHLTQDGQPNNEGKALLTAIASAGCFLNDTVTITRQGNTFSAVAGGDTAPIPPPADRPTIAQTLAAAPSPGVPAGFTKTIKAADVARSYAAFLAHAVDIFAAQGLKDVSTDKLADVAMHMNGKACDDRTVIPTLVESEVDVSDVPDINNNATDLPI